MGTSGRLGDGGIEDPDIRPGGEVMIHDVDNAPADERMVHDVDNAPAPTQPQGGFPLIPIAIGGLVIVVAVAAFSFLKSGPAPTPSASAGLGASASPQPPGATPGGGGPVADESANLVLNGADVSGSWDLDGGADVSPTTEIIAAVWTETVDDVDAGYGDLIVLSMGGPVFEGTQVTSATGISIGISISRFDAQGTDLFDHTFASRAGECQVAMHRTATGVAGTFVCSGIKDADGHTADATGAFAT